MVVGGLLCLSGLRGCLDHLALPDGKGGCTRLDTHRMHRAREDLVSRVLGEHLRRQLLLSNDHYSLERWQLLRSFALTVSYLLAPGDWHHFHIAAWAQRFQTAKVLICPGVEKKQPLLNHNGFIHDYIASAGNDDALSKEFEAVFSAGFDLMHEVVMYHKVTRHLLLVDLVEHIGDDYVGYNRCLRLFWCLFGMWNQGKPAPEYQFGVGKKDEVRRFMREILEGDWKIEGIILSHGNNLLHVTNEESKDFLRGAWKAML